MVVSVASVSEARLWVVLEGLCLARWCLGSRDMPPLPFVVCRSWHHCHALEYCRQGSREKDRVFVELAAADHCVCVCELAAKENRTGEVDVAATYLAF